MLATSIRPSCPKCQRRHSGLLRPNGAYSHQPAIRAAATVRQRRDVIATIMAEYAAAHPGATEANTSILDVSLWLCSTRMVRPVFKW
jgi:hypothetical protein